MKKIETITIGAAGAWRSSRRAFGRRWPPTLVRFARWQHRWR